MRFAFWRRFEHQEKDHRPPSAYERRDSDRRGVCRVGVETRVRLRANRPALLHLEVKRQLIGVIEIAERAEGRPLAALSVRRRAKIAVERNLSLTGAHMQFVFIGVEQFDSMARALRKWKAMPGLLHRPVFSGLAFAAPAWDFELGAPWIEPRRERSILDLHRRATLPQFPNSSSYARAADPASRKLRSARRDFKSTPSRSRPASGCRPRKRRSSPSHAGACWPAPRRTGAGRGRHARAPAWRRNARTRDRAGPRQ